MTMQKLSQLSASDLAAWWGAVVATAVLFWDVMKFRKAAAAIRVVARQNMQFMGATGLESEKYIFLTATNHGGAPTTITHVVAFHYSSWLTRLLGRPDM